VAKFARVVFTVRDDVKTTAHGGIAWTTATVEGDGVLKGGTVHVSIPSSLPSSGSAPHGDIGLHVRKRHEHAHSTCVGVVWLLAKLKAEKLLLDSGLDQQAEHDQGRAQARTGGSSRGSGREHGEDDAGINRMAYEPVRAAATASKSTSPTPAISIATTATAPASRHPPAIT
jgi:hypothetical protein